MHRLHPVVHIIYKFAVLLYEQLSTNTLLLLPFIQIYILKPNASTIKDETNILMKMNRSEIARNTQHTTEQYDQLTNIAMYKSFDKIN